MGSPSCRLILTNYKYEPVTALDGAIRVKQTVTERSKHPVPLEILCSNGRMFSSCLLHRFNMFKHQIVFISVWLLKVLIVLQMVRKIFFFFFFFNFKSRLEAFLKSVSVGICA